MAGATAKEKTPTPPLSKSGAGGAGRGRGKGKGGRPRSARGNKPGTNKNSNSRPNTPQATAPKTNANNNAAMPICKYYLQGRCVFGSNCRYRHTTEEVQKKNKNVREFDQFKAEAIHIARGAQDSEPRVYGILEAPFYSLDVECVAIGYGHTGRFRYPGRVALVKDYPDDDGMVEDDNYKILVDEIVNLEGMEVASYMTKLTGLTAEMCLDAQFSKSLDDIRKKVKELLTPDAVLIGHSIDHDIHWLGLEQGVDFKESFDTSLIFRQRLPKNLASAGHIVERMRMGEEIVLQESKDEQNKEGDENVNPATNDEENAINPATTTKSSPEEDEEDSDDEDLEDGADENKDALLPFETRYRTFSLRHCCIHLLGVDIQESAHNPVMDARYSLLLFHRYRFTPPEMLRAVRDGLHRSTPTPSFASENPLVEGVCLSMAAYKYKFNAKFIWKWWTSVKEKRNGGEK